MGLPTDLVDRVARIDALLRPIAQRPVDTTDPDWETRMRERPRPLDEAGVRADAEAALRELLARYEHGDDEDRDAVRALLERCSSFRWATHLPYAHTAEGFRQELLHLSARDQGHDTRDELLTLHDLCAQARRAGVDIRPLLLEVAALSSTEDKYGMGSVQALLRAAG
ncbi:hypothetical protein [Streptomyces griseoruber]|uniref:Uncharacterized protein n=1 Tax=Streptomyces griseoruber TaxID=1943 RepID=A0A101SSV5_9ACTN|nr:hypothetical protein [Streptomyces griseoruber]KUN79584.1 hypothetical protein AQJ64_27980 [Streptomyces griseoruber]